jgi:hypothetical protein
MISHIDRKAPRKLNGFVLWQGASLLDGKPIVLIATKGSKKTVNEKTGAMIQTYILRSDIPPIEAMQKGEDASICGACPHRPINNGTCYVRIDTGPNMVWKAYKRGRAYANVADRIESLALRFPGRAIRLGSYGDPAAIPIAVWQALLANVAQWSGYTHNWQNAEFQGLKRFCMASCDTVEEDTKAKGLGWRSFTIVSKQAYAESVGPVIQGSFLCPASEEGGRKITCSDCLACDGIGSHRKASVYIPVHGVAFKQTRFNNLIQIGGL